jgi:cyclase
MLAKRIIPCLDVRDGLVVKGIKFENHRVVGEILHLASLYEEQGADELVFYDITASTSNQTVSLEWVSEVAHCLSIPFTVAGGIRSVKAGASILNRGADKLSINSPALERPELINELSDIFGRQCVVIGIDSQWIDDDYYVYQYTGDVTKSKNSRRKTREWVAEVEARGAGEIVLNCMGSDGVRAGYDLEQLKVIRALTTVPLIASGGAGAVNDFIHVFEEAHVDGALAASVFHDKRLTIAEVKQALKENGVEVRI